jgi:ABC-type nitrate/sulfonate/bicarbonate transport system substrate-binding protein
VAKEARIFEKHGLDVAPVLIPSSVRALQAILAAEIAIGESAGPAVVSARLAGGDVVAIAGSVNILTYYFVTVPNIKRAEDLRGKIGANQSPGTIADFALRVSLRKLGLDPVKDVSLRSIGVLYDRIAALEGYQVVVQEMASTNPKATAVSVRDLIDIRFVKELEDGGFIASLYKK